MCMPRLAQNKLIQNSLRILLQNMRSSHWYYETCLILPSNLIDRTWSQSLNEWKILTLPSPQTNFLGASCSWEISTFPPLLDIELNETKGDFFLPTLLRNRELEANLVEKQRNSLILGVLSPEVKKYTHNRVYMGSHVFLDLQRLGEINDSANSI